MRRPHHVVLVPGFFGFANLGDFAYFGHVRDILLELGPSLGLDGELRVVATEPTASLTRRAALLAESISHLLDRAPGDVTLVGHSSGGLDVRLLLHPGTTLPTAADVERCASAVRCAVLVSTPNQGTPLAHLFTSLLGQELLRLLSLATIHTLRSSRLPVTAVLKLAGLLRGRRRSPTGVVDQVLSQLLMDFSGNRRKAVEAFIAGVGTDQGLVAQIAPDAMEVFNASIRERPGVRYGCVVTRARPPGLRSFGRAGLSVYGQSTHAVFLALYRFAAGGHGQFPRVTADQAAALRHAYGRIPDARANDGVVPTLSQLQGQVVAAAWADHHDVIGHFDMPTHVPPHFDWVASGTGFDRPEFERVWNAVVRFAAGAAAS